MKNSGCGAFLLVVAMLIVGIALFLAATGDLDEVLEAGRDVSRDAGATYSRIDRELGGGEGLLSNFARKLQQTNPDW